MPTCGNGVAEQSAPGNFVCIEDCDAEDLRGATCGSLGYRDGSLSCTGACDFDVSKCESCAPLDAHLLACRISERQGWPVALAAKDDAIALAFVEDGGLWVETLTPDLSALTAPHRIASVEARNLDLLATPNGWFLAALGDALDLYALDPSGGVVSSSVLTRGLAPHDGPFSPGVKLVGRAAGGAFALWQALDATGTYDLETVALAPDGSAEATPTRIATLVDSVFSAASTPQGMLVAGRTAVTDGSGNSKLVTFQIGAGGAPVGQPRLVDPFGEYPIMAASKDGGVVLAYSNFDPDGPPGAWVNLDASGVPRTEAVAIAVAQSGLGAIVPLDSGYVAVTRDLGTGFLGIDENGAVTTPAATIVMDPGLVAVTAARCGSEVVVALQLMHRGLPSFGLARIAP